MHAKQPATAEIIPLGIGYYTASEAARLLKVPARNIGRWLGGYTYRNHDGPVAIEPLWIPQLPRHDRQIELGFRDLIELRFISAFIKAGLSLKTIRHCLGHARDCVGDDRPFSTRRFQTDGRTIFLDSLAAGQEETLDLKRRQYVFRLAIEKTFRDLDIADNAVARWRPYDGKDTIVIDPTRAFGQPIASEYGVPTATLVDAVQAEGSIERVAYLFEVPAAVVRDSVQFEKALIAA